MKSLPHKTLVLSPNYPDVLRRLPRRSPADSGVPSSAPPGSRSMPPAVQRVTGTVPRSAPPGAHAEPPPLVMCHHLTFEVLGVSDRKIAMKGASGGGKD